MLYMLDTNICCYILNKQPTKYYKKLEQIERKCVLSISSIVLSELQFGVANSRFKEQNQLKLNLLISKLKIIDYSAGCAFFYGEIRANLKSRSIIIGNNDLFIASHAMHEQATLITNNASEFKRVDGLVVEDWS